MANGMFRPVEEIALNRCRRDMLASANFPAWQRWINIVKGAIKDQIANDEAHVREVEEHDFVRGITWSHK